MVRGMIIVICPHCGKAFVALDVEWGTTALFTPSTVPIAESWWIRRVGKDCWGLLEDGS